MTKKRVQKGILGFMAPGLVVMATFFLVPIAMTIFYSFTNLSLTGAAATNLEFIGLGNYTKLFKDPTVASSIRKTIVYTVFSVVGQNILGFLIAHLMQEKNSTFRRILGPIFLSGWVMPEVVGALCAYSFFTDKGTLNVLLQAIGLNKVPWLFKYPMFSVTVANIWRGTAYSMMVYQAALDNVSGDVKEAAKIDGATRLQTVLRVIVPIIKNTIMTNVMLTTLMTMGGFGLIWMMTAGGPGISTQTLPVLMYLKAFKNYELGYGTAISMILLLFASIFGFIYAKVEGREMEGGNER